MISFKSLVGDLDKETDVTDLEKCVVLLQMLTFVGDDLYDKSELDKLKIAVDDFTQSPNTSSFDQLHDKWLSAYKKWQYVEMFNIAKAEEIMYFNTINTYPVDEIRIKENINSQKNDLSNSNDWSCQGFFVLIMSMSKLHLL